MPAKFVERISTELERDGYLVELSPRVPGVQALLAARSPRRLRLGAAKVEEHFLFVDWGNGAFGRLDRLLEIYRRFSGWANQGFRIPHALRMQIPNLAVVAVSPDAFPEEAVRFARAIDLNPWYGGEVGQIILVDLGKQEVISLVPVEGRRYPRPGALPLSHAAEVIRAACGRVFEGEVVEG
jgi:hypothetical protein